MYISVASGKGGVGKTMISASIGYELSSKGRVLICDFDFFNRGMTGLVRNGCEAGVPVSLNPPKFLPSADISGDWTASEIFKNCFFISYPDISMEQFNAVESRDIEGLAREFYEFLEETAKQLKCDFIILDCHGGPDRLSFAAYLISDKCILVSEPDRATLYGTLHFLRQMHVETNKKIRGKMYIVFNRVPKGFSFFSLNRFYKKHLSEEFGGSPLLCVIPQDGSMAREFERHTFITYLYPYSVMSRKIRSLISVLFKHEPQFLPKSVSSISKISALWDRYRLHFSFYGILTKISAPIIIGGSLIVSAHLLIKGIFDADIVINLISKAALSLYDFVNNEDFDIRPSIFALVLLTIIWGVVVDFSSKIRDRIVYYSRSKSILMIFASCLSYILYWSTPSLFPIALCWEAAVKGLKQFDVSSLGAEVRSGAFAFVAGFILFWMIFVYASIVDCYRSVVIDMNKKEFFIKIVVLAFGFFIIPLAIVYKNMK